MLMNLFSVGWDFCQTEAAVQYGAMVAMGTFLRRGLCSQVSIIFLA